MSVFREHIKNSISNRFGNEIDVFVSRKRFDYFAFKQPLLSYPFYKELFHFVGKKKESLRDFFEDYEIVFPHLISSLRWIYEFVFFQKTKKD